MTSTKRFLAQMLYRRHVTVTGRRSSGVSVQFAFFGISATAAVLTNAAHTGSSVNFVLQRIFLFGHHISHRFHHLRCHLFPFRPRPSGPAAFFAPHVFIFFIIWSTCSSHITICGCVSHRCWQFLSKFCHVGSAFLSHLLKMSCHALASTSWISFGSAISFLNSSFVSLSRVICCKTLIWGLLSFFIHSKSSDDPALHDSWSFHHFVLLLVPSVFLMHLVRQHDHEFVNFRQGFAPSQLTELFLAPQFTHCWKSCPSLLSHLVPSLFSLFPGRHTEISAFDLLQHVSQT